MLSAITRILASGALAALAIGGCSDNCLDHCPAPHALGACSSSAPSLTVDELLADPTPHLGTAVTVRGTLAEEAAMCTQLGCFDGCCNMCGARLTLAGTGAHQLPLDSQVAILRCSGDESRVCCPLRLGVPVRVEARFAKEADTLTGPTFVLSAAVLCAASE